MYTCAIMPASRKAGEKAANGRGWDVVTERPSRSFAMALEPVRKPTRADPHRPSAAIGVLAFQPSGVGKRGSVPSVLLFDNLTKHTDVACWEYRPGGREACRFAPAVVRLSEQTRNAKLCAVGPASRAGPERSGSGSECVRLTKGVRLQNSFLRSGPARLAGPTVGTCHQNGASLWKQHSTW